MNHTDVLTGTPLFEKGVVFVTKHLVRSTVRFAAWRFQSHRGGAHRLAAAIGIWATGGLAGVLGSLVRARQRYLSKSDASGGGGRLSRVDAFDAVQVGAAMRH